MKTNNGFTLTELMVSLVVGSLVSLAAVTAFSTQSALVSQQTLRMQAAADGQEAYEILSGVLRHSGGLVCDVDNATERRFDVALPANMRIWPNTADPFPNNFVRLRWDKTNNQIGFTAAPSLDCNDGTIATTPLLGSTNGYDTRISDFDITDNLDGSLRLELKVQAGTIATTSTLYSNILLPRNR